MIDCDARRSAICFLNGFPTIKAVLLSKAEQQLVQISDAINHVGRWPPFSGAAVCEEFVLIACKRLSYDGRNIGVRQFKRRCVWAGRWTIPILI
jgi:hypothetical protein